MDHPRCFYWSIFLKPLYATMLVGSTGKFFAIFFRVTTTMLFRLLVRPVPSPQPHCRHRPFSPRTPVLLPGVSAALHPNAAPNLVCRACPRPPHPLLVRRTRPRGRACFRCAHPCPCPSPSPNSPQSRHRPPSCKATVRQSSQ